MTTKAFTLSTASLSTCPRKSIAAFPSKKMVQKAVTDKLVLSCQRVDHSVQETDLHSALPETPELQNYQVHQELVQLPVFSKTKECS